MTDHRKRIIIIVVIGVVLLMAILWCVLDIPALLTMWRMQ